ncbi:Homeobox protein vent1 [Liparis tanakae]|uniref:Homeobox protein vent1 n=1 Tax=Liparis tanakae TaxID=230148 RepID=A0A4Z2EWV5_9TELE|nr:Homeobox protein vent1 [Liparis tanakae]
MPCMVQPRPPSFGKGYLQPKPKASPHADSSRQDSGLYSSFHPPSCASPVSEMSGYSSGYESEAASSSSSSSSSSGCLSVDEGSDAEKDAPQRRVRTKFSPEQISKLEKIFNKHKYLDAGERVKTAQRLSLSETQVRTWFQNRRMKLKREFQDYLAPQLPPVLFQSLAPGHQYHGAAFYPAPSPQLVLQQQLLPQHHLHQHHLHPPPPPPHLMVRSPHFY